VVIVSFDFEIFYHVHPEDWGIMPGTDTYYVYVTFPKTGNYIIGVDFAQKVNGTVVYGSGNYIANAIGTSSNNLTQDPTYYQTNAVQKILGLPIVSGDFHTHGINVPALVDSNGKQSYTVKVTFNNGMSMGYNVCVPIMIEITNPSGNPAVNEFVPYLGGAAHLTFVPVDGKNETFHTHAMPTHDMTPMMMSDCTGNMVMPMYPANTTFGPQFMSTMFFTHGGKWQLFVQMQHKTAGMLVGEYTVDVQNMVGTPMSMSMGMSMSMSMDMSMSMNMGASSVLTPIIFVLLAALAIVY